MTTKTISSYYAGGYTIAGGVGVLVITPTGTVAGPGLYASASVQITNDGLIDATVFGKAGIQLKSGGIVNNGGFSHTAAQIVGGINSLGVLTVTNYGTIASGGVSGQGGGTLTNGPFGDTSALIVDGVFFLNGAGAVTNYGTIVAADGTAVDLDDGGAVTNGAEGDVASLIKGSSGVVIRSGGTLTNYGMVIGASGAGAGFNAGGAVINGSATDTQATIAGVGYGVSISGGAGTVTNYGTIREAGHSKAASAGVYLKAGGNVRNGSYGDTGALISGWTGVLLGAAGSVNNYGTIAGQAYGIDLTGGGKVRSGSDLNSKASILAASTGIFAGASATIYNFGLVSGLGNNGIALINGGEIINGSHTDRSAIITGPRGVFATNVASTIFNYGTIRGAGGHHGGGVYSQKGGSVFNGGGQDTSALIEGGTGVYLFGAGTVDNFGTIVGTNAGTAGAIRLGAGGVVVNGSATDKVATLDGYQGVSLAAYGLVTNFGTIHSWGVTTASAGILANAGAYVVNGSVGDTAARIEGYRGVWVSAGTGTLSNYGTVVGDGTSGAPAVQFAAGGRVTNGFGNDTSTLIVGRTGVEITGAAGTVANSGVIDGLSGYGVLLFAGGTVTNGGGPLRSSLIEGALAVVIKGGPGVITNSGTLLSKEQSFFGAYLGGGGALTNGSATNATALIEGYSGVGVLNGANGVNFGTILGQGDAAGEGLDLGGSFTNGSAGHAKALIDGYVGVSGYGTLTNFGTIIGEGGTAVAFAQTIDTLIVEAGCVFGGQVLGGGGTLELANGTGTLTGLLSATGDVTVSGSMATTTFHNFGTVEVGPSGQFTLAGPGTIAAGQTLTVFGALTVGDTLTSAGQVDLLGLLAGAGTLAITAGELFVGGGGSLSIANVAVSGATTMVSIAVPNFSYAGVWTQTGGTLSGSLLAPITFTGASDSFAGTFASIGTIVLAAGGAILSGQSLAAQGTLNLTGGTLTSAGTLTLTGALSGAGTLALTGGSMAINAGASLSIAAVSQGAASVGVSTFLAYGGTWNEASAGTLSVASGQVLTLTGAGDVFSGTLAGAGSIFFKNGGALAGTTISTKIVNIVGSAVTLSGAIANTGAINVNSGTLTVAASGATLSGTGTIQLSGAAQISGATAAATLTNVSDLILGAGQLGAGQMVLVNQAKGVIRNLGTLLTIDTGAATIANAGFIEANAGGGVEVKSAIANTGQLRAQGGILTVDGVVSGAGAGVIQSGTLKFAATATFNENVSFIATTGTLELAHGQTYSGTVSGFSKGGSTFLELDDINSAGATASWSKATGNLTVADGTHTAVIHLAGDYTGSNFVVADDGHGHALIHDPNLRGAERPAAIPRVHPFIAAAAGFGATASAAHAPTAEAWRAPPILASPRGAIA